MSEQKEKINWRECEVGALWKREASDNPHLSGSINIDGTEHKIFIFKNKFKEEDKHPDYRVYITESKAAEKKVFSQTSKPTYSQPAKKKSIQKTERFV
jgi:uncharacterized protein (DUF736 family)